MSTPKSLRVNGCRILPKHLRAAATDSERHPRSEIDAALTLADYAASVKARRVSAEVVTIRFDRMNVTDRGVVEAWIFHITQGDYTNTAGTYINIVEYDLPITDAEAEIAKKWLES